VTFSSGQNTGKRQAVKKNNKVMKGRAILKLSRKGPDSVDRHVGAENT